MALLANLREQVIQRNSMLKQGKLTSVMTRDSITNIRRMYRCSADDNIDSFSETCHSIRSSIKSLHLGLIIGFSILGFIIIVSILSACCFCCIRRSTWTKNKTSFFSSFFHYFHEILSFLLLMWFMLYLSNQDTNALIVKYHVILDLSRLCLPISLQQRQTIDYSTYFSFV